MTSEDRWRGHDRWDGPSPEYWRQGRYFDQRGPGYDRYPRRHNGDWMRETPWLRDSHWMRDSHWTHADVEGGPMVKVIEVLAQSPHSWEDATRRAVAEASRTIRGIRSIWVQDMQAVVEDEQVVSFRINAKISFALDDNQRRR